LRLAMASDARVLNLNLPLLKPAFVLLFTLELLRQLAPHGLHTAFL
jgi:hypothetical protein